VKLGAKGEKKKNRKCQKCGIADGHNSRTCLTVEENRTRLAELACKKRGRPPGSKNKSAATAAQWNEASNTKKQRLVITDSDESDDE